ncbi:hypothetical protein [Parendozoicomonas haliclonae]|uniref:Uncharacterized protein n=1 Tax=Parendozoicomonas haliclonae TaxID=1960125 RepID=A0A1X7ALP4_9GAMM|nr:hypothetical protein [Parendozoicomonas haliclonae]SMA48389.1 hypothetical protein EHSB41UT_02722 [Parendozoicomonas haliclonae]
MSDLRTNQSTQSASLWDKAISFFKGEDIDNSKPSAVEGKSYLSKSGSTAQGTRLSERNIRRLDQPAEKPSPEMYQEAMDVISLRGAIHEAKDQQKLDALRNQINNDPMIDGPNRSSLNQAIDKRAESLIKAH